MSRKLDAALAEALGWTEIGLWSPAPDQQTNYWGIAPFGKERVMPYYSTDGNAMLELDREMRARGFVFWVSGHIDGAYKFAADCFYPEATLHDAVIDGSIKERMVFADTMPEAMALAAYRALTGKEWSG